MNKEKGGLWLASARIDVGWKITGGLYCI